jgi:hypothetical protein
MYFKVSTLRRIRSPVLTNCGTRISIAVRLLMQRRRGIDDLHFQHVRKSDVHRTAVQELDIQLHSR